MIKKENTTPHAQPDQPPKASSPLADLLLSVVIPSVILLKFSDENSLGATPALMVALAFPLGWGIFSLLRYQKFNYIALLGLISIGLTGSIGLLKLDPQWLAIKEAAIPGVLAAAVFISTLTRYPLVNWLVYNPSVMNVEKIKKSLNEPSQRQHFDTRLLRATYLLGATFLFSAFMNYMLAKWIVTSPAGSAAFNEELAKMTMLSYPVIAIPSSLAMLAIIYYLWKTIHSITGLEFEEILAVKK
ncbi:MAG: MFS transporter [uncultured Thiotrichaceae bacterium]|uniref:MFS transporter n=1 Tax=uncultured Thiotrichaceae bacterium TaxID=298394 RepID=A0A6S6TP82_9GAMM|nr:MAG: MFS transporter [uncultured Thiotrichaceae bacterium]